MAAGSVCVRDDRDVPPYRRAGVRSPRPRDGRRFARSRSGDVPAEHLAAAQDRHVAPVGALVAAAPRGARALLGRASAEPTALPELPHGRGGDAHRFPEAVAVRAGWKPGEIRSKMFRHTYCAARLQTVDQGAPVSTYTVAREMGHGGEAMVRRVYGHLGHVRHRSEAVEYRVEQHAAKLGARL